MTKLSAGKLIGAFIVMLVGLALIPSVAGQAAAASADGNVSGTAAATVIDLLPLMYVFVLFGGIAAYVVYG